MRTTVSSRGQVSVPSKVREQLSIRPNSIVEWVIEGKSVRVIPIPANPAAALRGSGKKGAVNRLLKVRQQDRRSEDAR